MAGRLTLLCVTTGEPHVARFMRWHQELALVLGARYHLVVDMVGALRHGGADPEVLFHSAARMYAPEAPQAAGHVLESVYARALQTIPCDEDDYVLRLDDDERVSYALRKWLKAESYKAQPHWKFCRRHWWETPRTYISTPPLYPDHQTRLSLLALSGGRDVVHAGSPFGGGHLAPESCYLSHFKFLIKSRAEREAIAARYDAAMPGGGTGPGLVAFSLPELMGPFVVEHLEPGERA